MTDSTTSDRPLRVTIALAGLHRVSRGAEVALESIGRGLAQRGHHVTLLGSGPARADEPYDYRRVPLVDRSKFARWPLGPMLRDPVSYEALTFLPGMARAFDPSSCDVTLTCGFPFESLGLRRPTIGRRPAHVFVTQNGDWPALPIRGEARLFSCDGLVCTNPVYFERTKDRWPATLIPNAIDPDRFSPGPSEREQLGLPTAERVVLMVSALIPSKRVDVGIKAVAALGDATLVVAGDGPEAERIDELGRSLLGERYIRRKFSFDEMPLLYRSADVFFHPTLRESFGNVYIEAMACGTRVVAHASGNTEWIVGRFGSLIDTDDHDRVVEQLRPEADVGYQAEAASQRVLEQFTWAQTARQYESFLRSVVSRHSTS